MKPKTLLTLAAIVQLQTTCPWNIDFAESEIETGRVEK